MKLFEMLRRHQKSICTGRVTGLKRKHEAITDDIDNDEDYWLQLKKTNKKVKQFNKYEVYNNWALDGDSDIDEQLWMELTKNTSGLEGNVNDGDDSSQRLCERAYIESHETLLSSNNITGKKYEPAYRNYQLLGDSQLVRFAEHVLHMRVQGRKRKMQYCISGLKINSLKDKLLDGYSPLHDQVIVLIGTNDMLNNTSYEIMERSYYNMLDHLRRSCSKIVLLTIPPVAKLEDDDYHWQKLRNLNDFILETADEKVSVVDLAPLFMLDNNKCKQSLYEKRFNGSGKNDMVHLNKDGLKLMQRTLDEMYFRHQ